MGDDGQWSDLISQELQNIPDEGEDHMGANTFQSNESEYQWAPLPTPPTREGTSYGTASSLGFPVPTNADFPSNTVVSWLEDFSCLTKDLRMMVTSNSPYIVLTHD
jgi:hypothetical protein